MNTNLQIEVEHNGVALTATLPEVFGALAEVLPIASKLFGSKKELLVDSRTLHAALQVVRDHSTWLSGVWKQYALVEGVDYFVERLDKNDMANWPAIKANGGKVPTVFMFPPKLAARIATMTKTATGEKIWNYMYAVTDAAHDTIADYYQKQIAAGNTALAGEKRAYGALQKKAEVLAEGQGFHSVTLAVSHKHDLESRDQLIEKLQNEAGKAESVKSLERLVEAAAKHMMRVASNPDKVKVLADEMLAGIAEIKGGNVGYCPAF